jgi:hypothetical protein
MSAVRRLVPLAVVGALCAAPARAHEPPKGIGLLWESDVAAAPAVIITNRGLVFADEADTGLRFSLRCIEAFGANIGDRLSAFLAPDDALSVGVYNGVSTSSDRGCTLAKGSGLPPTGETLGNVVGAVGAPGRLFVSTRTFSGYAALFQSEDYGRTWSERFKNPVDHQFDVLLVSPASPQRLYAAGRWRDLVNQKLNFVTVRSQDLGASWQEQEAPLKAAAFAVHPGNADVVFAYQPIDTLETQFRVLRSADGGASYTPVLENVAQPSAIAAGADGSLWLGIGGIGANAGRGGLYRSSDDGLHFEKVFADGVNAVSCLERRQGRLWMCANLKPNFDGIWFSDDDGVSFRRWMIFQDVTQQVACSDENAISVCSRAWYDYDTELHPPGIDAGVGAPQGLNLDGGAGEAGAPGQPDASTTGDASSTTGDASSATDAGTAADAGGGVLADGGISQPPGLDAGTAPADAGVALDADVSPVVLDAAAALDAGAGPDDAGCVCSASPRGALDSLGGWLLGVWALLARARRQARRRGPGG